MIDFKSHVFLQIECDIDLMKIGVNIYNMFCDLNNMLFPIKLWLTNTNDIICNKKV